MIKLLVRLMLVAALVWPTAPLPAQTAQTAQTAPASPRAQPPHAHAPLVVVADDNYPPYLFRQPDGTAAGYLVDLWALWEQKTGVPVRLQASDWARAKATMAAGRADVIDTIFQTPEREAVMDFDAPYADLPVPIYVHRGIGGITGVESLHGFLVAVKTGDACVERLQAAGITSFQFFESYARIVDAAAADTLRIFCMDEPPADYLLYRSSLQREFRKAFVLYTGQFHRAVKKGDAATLALLRRGFDAIGPAETQALKDKWMARVPEPFPWARPLGYGLAAAVAVALLMAGWGMTLRRMVRRRTAELQEQRQRLRTLFDTLPDLVWLKGMDGRYVTCNTLFERLCGATEAEIIGRSAHEVLDADTADAFLEGDRRALQLEGPYVLERWLTFKDSGYRGRFDIIKTPMRDGARRVVGVLTIARDVTQHREAQERLQQQNRLYRVLNGVADTIATTRDPCTLLGAVCRIVVDEGGLRMAWIGEPDADGTTLRPVTRAGSGTDYCDEVVVSTADDALGLGPTGIAFREGRSAAENDIAAEPAMQPWQAAAARHQFLSSAAFPIRVRRATRAVLNVYSDRVGYFDDEEMQVLERLALQVGVALEAAEAEAARARAEAGLRASEERFSRMFRTSPVGMALSRLPDGQFVDVNDAWLGVFGHSREAVIGKTGVALSLWCDPALRAQVIGQLLRSEPVDSFDTTMRRADGSVVDIAFASTLIEIGGEQFVLASFVDVSLRRQAEKTLEDQAEQLELLVAQRTEELNSIFQALPDLYFRLSADGRIVDYRAGRRSDLMSTPEQFMGKTVAEVLPPHVAAPFEQASRQARQDGEMAAIEYALNMPAGEVHFEARLVPFRQGELIVVVRNISERIALEQAREATRGESERLSRLRTEFLANMSHEVRTPLNGIMGMAQIGFASSRDPKTHDAFARILDASRLLLGIVNDVLDFSKIDANRLELEAVPVDLRALIAACVETVRESALAKGLALSSSVAPDLPPALLGDPLRLRQILLNLLTNAVKFTERGDVAVWAGPEGGAIVLRVSDTGIGLNEQQVQQLFVPFQQADSSTTRRFGGTGLGLTISRRLAQLMGGDIHVQSERGRGSVFELRVPLQAMDAASLAGAATAPWQPDRRRLDGLAVLVAEDNAVNQIIIETALSSEGATVVIADDGAQALRQVESPDLPGGFDLVLMDLQMPLMDGYEATRRIHEIAPGLPVVGQTAHAMSEERDRCLAAGMVAHVAKPIDLELLVATVRRHARRREGAPGT